MALTARSTGTARSRTARRGYPLLYTKAFVAHVGRDATVPCERLLLMDIVGGGGGYRELSGFLRVTPPNEPFPGLAAADDGQGARVRRCSRRSD